MLAAAAWAAWLLYALAFAAVMGAAKLELSFDADAAGYTLGLASIFVFLLALLLASAGLVLGIRALVKREPRRGTAVLGLVMSMLCLLPSVLLIMYVASIR
jgi:hypothetical protein